MGGLSAHGGTAPNRVWAIPVNWSDRAQNAVEKESSMGKHMLWGLILALAIVALVLGGCPSSKPVATQSAPGDAAAKPAATDRQAEPARPAAVTLTKDQVKKFLLCMNDRKLDAAMTKIAEGLGLGDSKDAAAIEKVLGKAAADPKINEIVTAHGFKDAAEWVATTKKVFPGLAHAMAVATAETMGIKVGSKEFDEMVAKSEFKDAETVFEKPTAEEQQIIDEAVKEAMASEMKGHEGK
jgi:hypothetical protein